MSNSRKSIVAAVLIVGVLLLWVGSFAPHIQDDDTIYISLAKALVDQGRLVAPQVVGEPPQTYQPLLSILISPILAAFPSFPGNLVPLTLGSSALLGLISLALFFRYLKSETQLNETQRWLVWLLTATSFVLLPYVVQYVMTETLYLVISLAALLLLARYERSASPWAWSGVLAALMLGLSYYARAVGMTLILAALLYLLVVRRDIRKTVFVAILAALTIAPWLYRTARLGDNALGGRYSDLLWRESYWSSAANTISSPLELIPRVFANLSAHVTQSFPEIFAPLATHPALTKLLAGWGLGWTVSLIGILFAIIVALGFISSGRKRVSVLHFYAPLYLLMILLPPWITIRNWVPLIPFLFLWLMQGLITLADWVGKRSHRAVAKWPGWVALIVLLVLAANLARDVGHLRRGAEFRRYGVPWPIEERVLAEASAWIRDNTQPDDLVLHIQPLLLWLYTGRQTTPTIPSNDPVQISTLDPNVVLADIYDNFDYVIRYGYKDLIPGLATALEQHPERFVQVYAHDEDPQLQIYRVVPPAGQ